MGYAKLSFSVEGFLRMHIGCKSIFLKIGTTDFKNSFETLKKISSEVDMSPENQAILINEEQALKIGLFNSVAQIEKEDFKFKTDSIEQIESNKEGTVYKCNGKEKEILKSDDTNKNTSESNDTNKEVTFIGLTAKQIISYVHELTDELITLTPAQKQPIIRKGRFFLSKHGYTLQEDNAEEKVPVPPIEVQSTEKKIEKVNGKNISFEGLKAKEIIQLVLDKTGELITTNPSNKKAVIKKAIQIFHEKDFHVDQHNENQIELMHS